MPQRDEENKRCVFVAGILTVTAWAHLPGPFCRCYFSFYKSFFFSTSENTAAQRNETFLQGHRVKDLGFPVCRTSVWALDLSFGLCTTVAKCSHICRRKKKTNFFCSTGDWTQCLIPVKHLSYILSQKKIFSNKIKNEKILFWAERCWSWLWISVFPGRRAGIRCVFARKKCFLELSDKFYGKYLCFHLSFKCVDGTLQLHALDTLQREKVWRSLRHVTWWLYDLEGFSQADWVSSLCKH